MATGDPNLRRDPDAPMAWGCAWWWFIWLILIIIFFAGGWWGGGWYRSGAWQGERAAQAPPGPSAVQAPPGPQTASAPPAEFLGRDVTVSGKVDAVLGAQAFTLASPTAGGHSLLVVMNHSATSHPVVKAGETVQVKGTVRSFDRTEFDKEAKADLPQDKTTAYAGRPAILASAVSEVTPK